MDLGLIPLIALLPSSVPASRMTPSQAARSLWLVDAACDDELASLTPSRKSGTGKLEYGDG